MESCPVLSFFFFLLVCLINGETIQNTTELKYVMTYLMSHYSVGGGKNTALAENTFLRSFTSVKVAIPQCKKYITYIHTLTLKILFK